MLLYNLIVWLYGLAIKLAAINKLKAKQWVNGRKNWRNNLVKKVTLLNSNSIVWVHCSSYGEFEQGRPLIEAIKKEYPTNKIVLSFFSPSGYEAFKDWSGADIVCYLPLDTHKNAIDFINIIKPCAAIFIKYEFWLNFLAELKNKNIPTFLVSAVFKLHHPFFKWYGSIFRTSLKTFNKLYIQDESSGKLLEKIGILNYEVCGDTRFDRVIEVKNNFHEIPYIKQFCGDKKVIVAGSTWPGDEELIIKAFKNLNFLDLKLIIVPHDVEDKNILKLTNLLLKNNLTFSLFTQQIHQANSNILVVDTMGLLSKIYYYSTIAYVGGGLNDGVHNCLEPAVYNKPIIFYGNNFQKYNEVVELISLNAAKNIISSEELTTQISFYLNDKFVLNQVEADLKIYFKQKAGTTKKIIDNLSEFINF